MQVTSQHGLVFNREKCEVKKDSVTFLVLSTHPDPKKVDAIHGMPPPENQTQLQQFLGMVTYLSPFTPSLSTHTAPLQNCWKRTQSSCGTQRTRKPSTRSSSWSARTPHSSTLTYRNLSLSKLMHQRDLEPHSCKMGVQLPLLPKLLHPQSNDMPT